MTRPRVRLHPATRALRRRHSRAPAMVRSASVLLKETFLMNNLHRELAPISDGAWAQVEEETSRTLKRHLAGRRVVDVQGPAGTALSAVGTGHLKEIAAPKIAGPKIAAPKGGIVARQREVKALVELRIPFELTRQSIDDVDRGANDSD